VGHPKEVVPRAPGEGTGADERCQEDERERCVGADLGGDEAADAPDLLGGGDVDLDELGAGCRRVAQAERGGPWERVGAVDRRDRVGLEQVDEVGDDGTAGELDGVGARDAAPDAGVVLGLWRKLGGGAELGVPRGVELGERFVVRVPYSPMMRMLVISVLITTTRK
jgi:hypothetical protein